MSEPLVELVHVTKAFGATHALADVSFDVRPGEIHVLAGENGAGKSTLIRILSGVITDHEGEVRVRGARVRFRNARDAARHGIATIHQELSLVGSMTVAENLALSRGGSMFGWTRRDDDVRAAQAILDGMDLDVDPLALVEALPLSAQQTIEIARALAQDARVLILDEPTSALSEPEAERLLARVERLAASGRGVVYISHRMEENDRLAHRITVLRDGRVVASRPAKDLPREALVALMMGTDAPRSRDSQSPDSQSPDSQSPDSQSPDSQSPDSQSPDSQSPDDQSREGQSGAALLRVRDLTLSAAGAAPLFGVSFDVARGEILGIAGLRGSGTSEVLSSLFGAFGAAARGEVTLASRRFEIASPARSIEQGVLFLANDRKKTVLPDLTLPENITLSSLESLARHGLLPLAKEASLARSLTASLRVATPSVSSPARALSGGNQQKVALLRCLCAEPQVLLLDEPTRGVDIGAKADIHASLRALAAGGKAILLVTSELPELLGVCDRILVLGRGRVAATFEKPSFSRDALRLALDG